MEEASEEQVPYKSLPSSRNISKLCRRGTLMVAFRDAMKVLDNKNGVDTRTIAKFIGQKMDTPPVNILPRLNDVINMAEGMGMVKKVASGSYTLKDTELNLCGVCGGMKKKKSRSRSKKKKKSSCRNKRRICVKKKKRTCIKKMRSSKKKSSCRRKPKKSSCRRKPKKSSCRRKPKKSSSRKKKRSCGSKRRKSSCRKKTRRCPSEGGF